MATTGSGQYRISLVVCGRKTEYPGMAETLSSLQQLGAATEYTGKKVVLPTLRQDDWHLQHHEPK